MTGYGSTLTATYTGDGLRATKTTSAGTTAFLYDGSLPVLEMTWGGAILAVNTFGPNGLLSRRSGGASTFYQFDPQGSVAQRLNSAGAVLSSDMYDAYGVGQSTGSNTDPWGYGAQWGYFTDRETGLALLTHRYYDPSAGRFLNRDPIGLAGGLNVYGYVKDNPANAIDPLGLCIPKPDNRSLWQRIKDAWDEWQDSLQAQALVDYLAQQASLGRNVLGDSFSDDPFLTKQMQKAFKSQKTVEEYNDLINATLWNSGTVSRKDLRSRTVRGTVQAGDRSLGSLDRAHALIGCPESTK
jgi:RHS repeat-associated protein